MARVTIHVPDKLKRRMDKAKPRPNWSETACRAFEQKLGEIAAQKERKTMQDVIDRLRASKAEQRTAKYRDGHEAGRQWAMDYAESVELERLADMRDSCGTSWEAGFETSDNDAFAARSRFVFWVRPEDENDRQTAKSFWEEAVGDGIELTDEFVHGFAEGALEVWGEVADEL